MKTKKQASQERELIVRHHEDPTDKHRIVKLPNIGTEYVQLLGYAQQGRLEYYNSDEWVKHGEWAAKYRPRTKMLQFMGLVDHKFRLTKTGSHYLKFYYAGTNRPRPVK